MFNHRGDFEKYDDRQRWLRAVLNQKHSPSAAITTSPSSSSATSPQQQQQVRRREQNPQLPPLQAGPTSPNRRNLGGLDPIMLLSPSAVAGDPTFEDQVQRGGRSTSPQFLEIHNGTDHTYSTRLSERQLQHLQHQQELLSAAASTHFTDEHKRFSPHIGTGAPSRAEHLRRLRMTSTAVMGRARSNTPDMYYRQQSSADGTSSPSLVSPEGSLFVSPLRVGTPQPDAIVAAMEKRRRQAAAAAAVAKANATKSPLKQQQQQKQQQSQSQQPNQPPHFSLPLTQRERLHQEHESWLKTRTLEFTPFAVSQFGQCRGSRVQASPAAFAWAQVLQPKEHSKLVSTIVGGSQQKRTALLRQAHRELTEALQQQHNNNNHQPPSDLSVLPVVSQSSLQQQHQHHLQQHQHQDP